MLAVRVKTFGMKGNNKIRIHRMCEPLQIRKNRLTTNVHFFELDAMAVKEGLGLFKKGLLRVRIPQRIKKH